MTVARRKEARGRCWNHTWYAAAVTVLFFTAGPLLGQPVCIEVVILNDDVPGGICSPSLRPLTTTGVAASFVLTARTRVDDSAPTDPVATGEAGSVFISNDGAGVKTSSCGGSKGISGGGDDKDEELIVTFDEPVAAADIVIALNKIDFAGDSVSVLSGNDNPVLFISSAGSPEFEFTIQEEEIQAAFAETGSQTGEVAFAGLTSLPEGLLVDRFKIRETNDHIWVDMIRAPIPGGTLCEPDCDNDGVPDAQEIAECPGTPDCDDCNLNEVPDQCDIDSGTSLDVSPADGIPDECIEPEEAGGNWTDDIWNLSEENPENPYPDNEAGVEDLHITLDAVDIFLDETVEIQSLRILNAGTLEVTQADTGDLTVAAVGGISNEGSLLVGHNRFIDASAGQVTIGPGGRYEAADPGADALGCAGGIVCASLAAGSLTIVHGDCEGIVAGGELNLEGTMSLNVSGDLVLDGANSPDCGGGLHLLGITPPPKFKITGSGSSSVSGSYSMGGASSSTNTVPIGILRSAPPEASGTIIRGMLLGGDFDNRSISPSLFDWVQGKLTLEGDTQLFEVAGLDLGPTPEGFLTDQDTLFDTGPHTNFSIGTVEVVSGTHVTFVNAVASTAGAGPCVEALYVDTLILQEGSTLTLDDSKVYYRSLEDNGAAIESVGCGELVGLCLAAAPTSDTVAKNRFLSFAAGVTGRSQAIRVTFEDLPPPHDVLNGIALWVSEPEDVSEDSTSVAPVPGFPNFKAATLQCEPFYADWSSLGIVHVYHEGIVPGGVYPIQAVDISCALDVENSFSEPLELSMARWGDIVADCKVIPCPPPNGTVSIIDVVVVLDKFANRPDAVSKVRADLEPALPDLLINIGDALFVLDGFIGRTFPFPPPTIPCGK